MSDLLKDYDEQLKKKQKRSELVKNCAWGFVIIITAIYFGNMFFGPSSLQTLLSLQTTKEQLQKRIASLKAQNAAAQKDYFELKGLYPNEK